MTKKNSISIPSESQETKKCTKCKKVLPVTLEFFYNHSITKDGLTHWCRACCKKYRDKNKEQSKANRELNKDRIKGYREQNKKRQSAYCKAYYLQNKERLKKRARIYKSQNKEIYLKKNKEYGRKNKDQRMAHRREKVTYTCNLAQKLSIYEEARESQDGYLQVKCAYCGLWLSPTNIQVDSRIGAINGSKKGECRIYCNNNDNACKKACPTYNQKLYPKGFKKATSREVNPLVRQLCFARDKYTCQKCGATIKDTQLHCHHIEGYTQNPLLGNDISNTITYCKSCHKTVHKEPGCGYHELRCGTYSVKM